LVARERDCRNCQRHPRDEHYFPAARFQDCHPWWLRAPSRRVRHDSPVDYNSHPPPSPALRRDP
jgi:hypothetical protein